MEVCRQDEYPAEKGVGSQRGDAGNPESFLERGNEEIRMKTVSSVRTPLKHL